MSWSILHTQSWCQSAAKVIASSGYIIFLVSEVSPQSSTKYTGPLYHCYLLNIATKLETTQNCNYNKDIMQECTGLSAH